MTAFRQFAAAFYCPACEEFHPFKAWARGGKMAGHVAMGCAEDGVWRWYVHQPLEDLETVGGPSIAVYRHEGEPFPLPPVEPWSVTIKTRLL